MKKIMIVILLLFFFAGVSFAAISTEQLAAKARQGQELFEALVLERNQEIDWIMSNPSKLPHAKELAVKNKQNEFLKKSREIHLKYREPFIRRVIAETNDTLPEGKKIKTGLGSDIYQRHKVTGNVELDQKGKKIINPKHRGMEGDLDLGGDGRAVKRLEENLAKYKDIYLPQKPGQPPRGVVTSSSMDAPGYRDFGDVEVTINISGEPDLPGSSAHQTRVQMDAFSKETYVSVSMRKNQLGRSVVETNDHIKKAAKGFAGPPAKLLGISGEKTLQGMSKGTLKSIESGKVDDTQLARALKESGYNGGIDRFKDQLENLKEGHLHQGVGLDKNNIEAFQKACKKTTEEALNNARQEFEKQKANVQARIEQYDAKIKSGELSGDQLERHKKVSKKLREELVDSKVKIEETSLANKVKLEGGSYDDYFQKNALTSVKPVAATPKMTRMQAAKNGLTPGLLDVAGYGMSAYNIYDNVTRMQKGEISQNDAVIGITTEVIDTGFGMVTDVGTAAAIGSIGTGAAGTAATIGVPFVVVAGAGYAVSTAAEEGLKTFAALKVEEIAEKIAKSKKEETINTLQLQAEELLKSGETTGDWRYFAKADDIANSLERMYQVTGDDDFKKTFEAVYNRVNQKKDSLEAKYNCSIYALQGKMDAAKAVELKTEKTEPAELKIRVSRALLGDQYGNYSITAPEGFKEPFTVRVAGGELEVKKSPDPLRGQFRGTVSASDSTHTLSFLVKDVDGRTARATTEVVVRGLDPKTINSMNRPPQTLYTAPPSQTPAIQSGKKESGEPDDYNKKIKGIMDNYNQEMIRIQQQKNKVPADKPQPQPATPNRVSGGSQDNQSQQKKCRHVAVNASSCRSSFEGCYKQCRGNDACQFQCGNANGACINGLRSQCRSQGGSLTGVGWNLSCTICQ
jgi:hypothetical protein